jgi:hypothetical protein
MGLITGGIILKQADDLSDEDILNMAGRAEEGYYSDISLEQATSADLRGTAIARLDDMALVFNKHLPYSCSFEEGDLSKIDRALEEGSGKGDILCFLINAVSDTYGWSIFSGGKRIRAKSVTGKEVLSEYGTPTTWEKGMAADEEGMLLLLEQFTGYEYINMIFEKGLRANAYRK